MMPILATDIVILVVDDDPVHLKLVKLYFRQLGMTNTVLTFEDGQQVAEFLFVRHKDRRYNSEQRYLLFLDIRMPFLDGIEVLSRVRSNPELQSLPVVMLTTTADPREINLCYDLGCNYFLSKPIGIDKFSEVLDHLMREIDLSNSPVSVTAGVWDANSER